MALAMARSLRGQRQRRTAHLAQAEWGSGRLAFSCGAPEQGDVTSRLARFHA
eukprot:CAMPEP_0170605222 /NCGR_PEP_ID=MMETSP0224-20130122/19861_1 /TAXON_ID=285029 /ORGANISM="Togula jolla, Strain CCCM 725" /LENGTH=51 /DNA_ID=CAMNT_0010930217 /DNA_START=843 /DNA_END=998 /DNA_ORIENTATION=-